jgi:hypothetical protein
MKHHKQVATTITFSDQQFATLIETLKTPIANPASDAKLEQTLTALSTWTENNPKLPTATDVAGITAAIQNSGDQTSKQLYPFQNEPRISNRDGSIFLYVTKAIWKVLGPGFILGWV